MKKKCWSGRFKRIILFRCIPYVVMYRLLFRAPGKTSSVILDQFRLTSRCNDIQIFWLNTMLAESSFANDSIPGFILKALQRMLWCCANEKKYASTHRTKYVGYQHTHTHTRILMRKNKLENEKRNCAFSHKRRRVANSSLASFFSFVNHSHSHYMRCYGQHLYALVLAWWCRDDNGIGPHHDE